MANLGVQTMEDCTISIEQSPLAGTWRVDNIWGALPFEEITFDENGALSEFFVAPLIEGGQTMIFTLGK